MHVNTHVHLHHTYIYLPTHMNSFFLSTAAAASATTTTTTTTTTTKEPSQGYIVRPDLIETKKKSKWGEAL